MLQKQSLSKTCLATFDNEKHLEGYVTYNTAYAEDENGTIPLYKDSNGYYKNRQALEAREFTETADGKTKTEVVVGLPYDSDGDGIDDKFEEFKDVSYNTETRKYTYTNGDGESVDVDVLYGEIGDSVVSEEQRKYMPAGTTIYEYSKALNFEGSTTAQRELYDYATALTEAYYSNSTKSINVTPLTYDANIVNYYKNIFNEMRTKGFTTVDDETKLKENDWFVRQLKAGKLQLSYFSTVEKTFVSTGLDSDESITQKEDSSAMAIAEQVYQNAMDKIERQDKQFDLQLNKLESEHSALSTEYDSVKNIIKKNVEKSFNVFNASLYFLTISST